MEAIVRGLPTAKRSPTRMSAVSMIERPRATIFPEDLKR